MIEPMRFFSDVGRRRLLLALFVVSLPFVVAAKMTIDVVGHNSDRDRFGDLVLKHPVPEGAVVADTFKEVGLLEGNGNHCDLQAWVELETALPASAVATHYFALEVNGLRVHVVAPGRIRVEIFESHGANPVGWDLRCG